MATAVSVNSYPFRRPSDGPTTVGQPSDGRPTAVGRTEKIPTAKKKNLTPKKTNADFFFGKKCFSPFSADFGGARPDLTSESDSSRYFTSDGQIFRSIRRLRPFSSFGTHFGRFFFCFCCVSVMHT